MSHRNPFLLSLICLVSTTALCSAEFKPGDIILQEGEGGQADMIKKASASRWTHVGVVVNSKKGKLMVLEAVQPVRLTKLSQFYTNSKKCKVFRLKTPLNITPEIEKKALIYIKKQLNKDYDIKFAWGNDKMYCSELVWKCYKNVFNIELCKPRPYESFNLKAPIVQAAIKRRFGGLKHLPKNHQVVAPGDIATSKLLKDVTAEIK